MRSRIANFPVFLAQRHPSIWVANRSPSRLPSLDATRMMLVRAGASPRQLDYRRATWKASGVVLCCAPTSLVSQKDWLSLATCILNGTCTLPLNSKSGDLLPFLLRKSD